MTEEAQTFPLVLDPSLPLRAHAMGSKCRKIQANVMCFVDVPLSVASVARATRLETRKQQTYWIHRSCRWRPVIDQLTTSVPLTETGLVVCQVHVDYAGVNSVNLLV